MELPSLLSISPLYIAIFGLLFFPFTLYVGMGRLKKNINLGDGGDDEMLKRIRAQANFIETVPIFLLLLVMMEVLGASDTWLHALGGIMVVGRILHYTAMVDAIPFAGRPIGMFSTLGCILTASIWILLDIL